MKQLMKSIFMANICLLCLVALFAAYPIKAAEKSESANMPIDLIADEGTYDQQAGVAIYQGNVKVIQGVSTIWADKMVITLKNNVAHLIEAEGKPVKFHYKGDKQPINGQGSKMVYEVPKKTVTLTGNAIVKQGKDVVKGEVITYDLTKEVIGGKRVKMTFLPKE